MALTFKQIYLFRNAIDYRTKHIFINRFRYTKSSTSTRWKKPILIVIMFSKDMAVVIYNHPRLPYHTSFIQLT